MILATDMTMPAIVAERPVAGPEDQATGPRPNRDPAAVPGGTAPEGDAPTLSFNVSVVSDYLFRGLSQSSGDPALQASAELAAPGGFYAGAFASNSTVYPGADVELDLYGGYRLDVGGLHLDAGVISYFYPGARGSSSTELYATAGATIPIGEVRAGLSYAPEQTALGDTDGLYLFAEGEAPVPATPITLRAHLGRERGVNVGSGSTKID